MKKVGSILELIILTWVEDEYIMLRFPSMCNIGYDMREALEELFWRRKCSIL